MALKTGDKAPDFTLPSLTPSADLVNVSLSSLKGKNVVLLFFPQAFTGVCTTEMCTMSENFEAYKSMNAEVLGISVDGTFVQKAFADANKITIPLLSDFNKDVIKSYDVVQVDFAHGMKEVAQRAVYVIDKEGVIRYVEVTENPGVQINFEGLKKAVEELK
ncbi:MAG: redoxin domain-containing protein [Ignavibacteria bacterium]|nr:redoxin domain-containing protein [Ignavibacteria bacterium]